MKRLLSIISFVFISFICFSQEPDSTTASKIQYGFCFGINISKFHKDNIDFNYATRPAVGLFENNKLSDDMNLKLSLLYSVKSSTLFYPGTKFSNTYFDLNIIPQYKLTQDLYLQAGLSYSQVLTAKKVILNGSNWNGVNKINDDEFNPELNITAGFECKIQDNINIDFSYNFIPAKKDNIQNFQILVNYPLDFKKVSHRKLIKLKSKSQIEALKNGLLLVRLKTFENKINALMEAGYTEDAAKVKTKQETENKKIVSAFRNYFNFCNVYFFFSNNTIEIKNRKFNNVFLNDSLVIDKTMTIDTTKSIFIAEFGNKEPDTTTYYYQFYKYEFIPDGNWSVKKVKRYYTYSPYSDFYALIIRDGNFVQLKKPFPFYVRAIFMSMRIHPEQALILPLTIYSLFLPWSYDKTVDRMNKKLHKYYEKSW
ncbi:MAG: outer membrane beta-barrel protein [Bacteroidia bacterium]|nr:outer membrane beta-barrel protein [Bacteroidia bacterium]